MYGRRRCLRLPALLLPALLPAAHRLLELQLLHLVVMVSSLRLLLLLLPATVKAEEGGVPPHPAMPTVDVKPISKSWPNPPGGHGPSGKNVLFIASDVRTITSTGMHHPSFHCDVLSPQASQAPQALAQCLPHC